MHNHFLAKLGRNQIVMIAETRKDPLSQFRPDRIEPECCGGLRDTAAQHDPPWGQKRGCVRQATGVAKARTLRVR